MTIEFFKDTKELEEFVGVSHDKMWDIGFNLDDCDGAIAIKKDLETKNWFYTEIDEWGYKHLEYNWMEVPTAIELMLNAYKNYCVGYSSVEYNGYYFFTIHHA